MKQNRKETIMTVELICVGTELLLGNIVNTNAAYLAEKCALLGLSMYYQSVVGDNPERLQELCETANKRSDLVILCGGLGPTQDDLTKETAARVMGRSLVLDERAKEEIRVFFERIHREVTDNNWKQAMVPEGSIVLYNANGTAPGIIIEGEGTTMILLPGPPNELVPMFEEQVYPYLSKRKPEVICSKMLKICGVGESMAETRILDLIEKQTNPTIAPYAKTGEVHLRITAKADSPEQAFALIAPVEAELYRRFGDGIFTEEESETLEGAIAKLLKERKLTVSTAESCTGGLLSGRLVNVPGISEQFQEGYITYSNEAKEKLLGVSHSTLETFGAVSPETAREMAEGCCRAANTDLGVGITGIAGPDGGTAQKPVGLVYIGCCCKGTTYVEQFQFRGNRSKVRESAVANALTLLRKVILQEIRTV